MDPKPDRCPKNPNRWRHHFSPVELPPLVFLGSFVFHFILVRMLLLCYVFAHCSFVSLLSTSGFVFRSPLCDSEVLRLLWVLLSPRLAPLRFRTPPALSLAAFPFCCFFTSSHKPPFDLNFPVGSFFPNFFFFTRLAGSFFPHSHFLAI